jgi:hypothetical protein
VAQLDDLLAFLQASANSAFAEYLPAVEVYRQRYGVI